ncbi:MAG: response regulator, partial [Acidobacteriota bacterium]
MALILMVDDEQDACQMMRRILSMFGHQVEAFTGAPEAIQWLKANEPDLALLDIKLRGDDGLSILEFIRKRELCTKV